MSEDADSVPAESPAGRLRQSPPPGPNGGVGGRDRETGERSGADGAPPADGAATSRRIDRLFLDLTREVGGRTSREAVERTVCERLAESNFYRRAWVGVRSVDDRVSVRTGFGPSGDTLETDQVEVPGDAADGRDPWERMRRTDGVTVIDADGIASGRGPAGDHDRNRDRDRNGDHDPGDGRVALVPLRHDGTGYGVLAVHTDRPNAFGEHERAGLAAVGAAMGAAVGAIRSRDLFFADGVVELRLRVTDGRSLLVRTTEALDCEISLTGYVPTGDRWALYCDVEGAAADAVTAAAARDPDVERYRTLVDRGGECRVQFASTESSVLDCVTDAGATVRTAVADHGVCRVVVEIPQPAEVREVLARLRSAFPDLELRSQRTRDRPPAEPTAGAGMLDDLTDRQREVLEASYRAGYFEWPRESTSEEVADGLGIASATLQGHLRKAERSLMADLFD